MRCGWFAGVQACILASGSALASAQPTAVPVPEGWVVSPGNAKAQGEAGYRVLHEATGIELCWVPAGLFKMGSEEGEADEQPVHEVELAGFWIGRTEVTVRQWRKIMPEVPFADVNTLGDDHPLVLVPWDQAQEFCGKLGLRLPTEAEWEYAAAGPESRIYPWGNEWDGSRLQWAGNKAADERTAPAGTFPDGASWCAALDMAGNVWEWCADWYDGSYYASSPRANPPGPTDPVPITVGFPDGRKVWWRDRRVIRGGCFANNDPAYFRCTMRNSDPSLCHYALGLRVARSP